MAKENPYHAKIEAEEKEVFRMGERIRDIEPDKVGLPDDFGEFKKDYYYGAYRDVCVRVYTKGALLVNGVTGRKEWFKKSRQNLCFEKAKQISGRYKHIETTFF